ncbi:MAG: HNH endonuclease [Desulfurellales bacterium]|nr:MAG: HNH endonuclease [Desulfurellales bacterium]
MVVVLVLNATYEPLGVISMERAITLVVLGDADIVLGTGASVRSQHLTIDEPSVIVLRHMIKIARGRAVPLSRKALFARDRGECAFCETGKAETIDHVFPRSRGGKHEWMNVVASCARCNHYKRDRTPEEAGLTLRWKPFIPSRAYMLGCRNRPEWIPFLGGGSE